jgi:hypothetical protein
MTLQDSTIKLEIEECRNRPQQSCTMLYRAASLAQQRHDLASCISVSTSDLLAVKSLCLAQDFKESLISPTTASPSFVSSFYCLSMVATGTRRTLRITTLSMSPPWPSSGSSFASTLTLPQLCEKVHYSASKLPFRSDDPMDSIYQQLRFGGRRFLRSSHCQRRIRPSELIVLMTCVAIQQEGSFVPLLPVAISLLVNNDVDVGIEVVVGAPMIRFNLDSSSQCLPCRALP